VLSCGWQPLSEKSLLHIYRP